MRFSRSSASGWITTAGPIAFGVAFLAPLIAQSLEATALPTPFGLERIHFGLALGLSLGVIAVLRGRWV